MSLTTPVPHLAWNTATPPGWEITPYLAFAAPDHGAHLRAAAQLVDDVEQLDVHRVVERVVLVGVVVRDRRDRAVDVEPHAGVGHCATLPQSAKPDGSWRPKVPCSNKP